MAVIVLCLLLVLAGVLMVVRWGGAPAEPRYLQGLAIAIAAGVGAGAVAAGAGGRLVMRLLALTSPASTGQTTEANEIVGRISFAGTIGFIAFAALFLGSISGIAYGLLRPVLPPGRAGGLASGALLLILAGTRLEPLRADNIDFALVGPGWLAVVGFAAVVVFQGMLVAAMAGRISRGLPLRAPPPPARPMRTRRALAIGRVALAGSAILALPGFITALAEILGASKP